jgi:hypothetical protein
VAFTCLLHCLDLHQAIATTKQMKQYLQRPQADKLEEYVRGYSEKTCALTPSPLF